MKLELMEGDSLEVFDDTPMYNPQGLPLIFYFSAGCLFSLRGLNTKISKRKVM